MMRPFLKKQLHFLFKWVVDAVFLNQARKWSSEEGAGKTGKSLGYRFVDIYLSMYLCVYIRVYIKNFNSSPQVCSIHLKPNHILPHGVFVAF